MGEDSDDIRLEFTGNNSAILVCVVVFVMGLIFGVLGTKAYISNQVEPTESQLEYFEGLVNSPPSWIPKGISFGELQVYYQSRPFLGREYVKPVLVELCKRGEVGVDG